MYHTETHCHCGAHRQGSDHCPECGCEEFETTCDHTSASALDRLNSTLNALRYERKQAEAKLDRLNQEITRHEKLYRRQALWLRADELRRELAKVVNEVENIKLDTPS